MLEIGIGDIIRTVNGKVLKVERVSMSYIYGSNIIDNVHFMIRRSELPRLISEVYYYG